MRVTCTALPTDLVRAYQAGGPDANAMPAERAVSDGGGNPCRHCLREIAEGAPMLVLAHRPFPAPQPYAEIGPIFLHAEPCERWQGSGLPPVATAPDYIVRGYTGEDRIRYGTGAGRRDRGHARAGGRAAGARRRRLCARPLGAQQLLPVPHRPGLSARSGDASAGLRQRHDPAALQQPLRRCPRAPGS